MSDVTQTQSHTSELAASLSTSPATRLATRLATPIRLPAPLRRYAREFLLPLFLLAVSVVTTTAIGARFMQNFLDGRPAIVTDNDLWPWPWLLADLSRFQLGWAFSGALLSILLTHEFGHYFACRAHRIRATLPCVLPAPTLSGTFGAVIQIRGRIPNRRALMDVGVYGPLAGYIASLIAVVAGFLLSRSAPPNHPTDLIAFGQPLTLRFIHAVLVAIHPATPEFNAAVRHPVLIAGWVGLLITSLNLIPGGQLDGGHILYAISPRAHRLLRWLLPAALLFFGFFFWVGWLLWGGMLLIPALRHPRLLDEQPLNPARRALGWVALALLLLTFCPAPFEGSSVLHYLLY